MAEQKRVAIVGSSGGNLYGIGGSEPRRLVDEIVVQCEAAGVEVSHLQFVAADGSMDRIEGDNVTARLLTLRNGVVVDAASGTVNEVNGMAAEIDREIAAAVEAGEVDGVILVSADPKGVNSATVAAAAARKIAAVGSGGTSVAAAQSAGLSFISVTGSTGTTNRTRAIGYVAALAKAWKLKYRPVIGARSAVDTGAVWRNFDLKGIMVPALPAFIVMALTLALSKIPGIPWFGDVFDVLIGALPVVVAVLAAQKVSGLDEVAVVAGLVAGVLSRDGGILGGIVGGMLAGVLVAYLLRQAFAWGFPGTTANIFAGGLAGLLAGLVVFVALAPLTEALGDGLRALIDGAVAWSPVLAGAIAGAVIWPAIIAGFYHAAILPIILLEMETVGNSFFGAVDMGGLVMVSAGITLANIVAGRRPGDRAVAAPGFAINIGFGTFVEAAYPFMFSDKLVFAGAILASTVSGALAGILGVRGTAYVPSIVAPGLSNNPLGFLVVMVAGLAVAFAVTFVANRIARSRGAV
jgi:hypothetical protein